MNERDFALKKRSGNTLPPEKLYNTLCKIYPEQVAARLFEILMGYPPAERNEDKSALEVHFDRTD